MKTFALLALFLTALSATANVVWVPPEIRYTNYEASTAPGVGDDANDGYEPGSHWVDQTADKAYICLDNTVGAAVWTESTDIAAITSVFTRTGAITAATNDYTWAQIDKATSDIADITTKSHTSLTDKGTTTHADLDTFKTNELLIETTTAEPTGFEDTSATLAFSTPTVTLSHPYVYWYRGTKFTSSGDATWTVPAVTGLYFIRFTDAAATAPTPSTVAFDFESEVPVAMLYWNNATSDAWFMEERHNIVMDWATHTLLHEVEGAKYGSGGVASGYVVDSDLLVDVQIALGASDFHDEDLELELDAKVEGSNWNKWYRLGASNVWAVGGTDDTIPGYHAGNVAKWNEDAGGGTYQLTSMTNNYYSNTWIVASNAHDTTDGFMAISGQAEYFTESGATQATFGGLVLTGLPSAEIVPLYQVVFRYKTTFTNNDARIEIKSIQDLRGTTNPSIGAAAPSDHGNLSGLGDNDHPQYELLAGSVITGTIATADVKTLNASPVVMIAAPGATLAVVIDNVYLFYDYDSTAYDGIAAGEDFLIEYVNSGTDILIIETTAFMDQAGDEARFAKPSLYGQDDTLGDGLDLLNEANDAVHITILIDEIATGDSPLLYRIHYHIVNLTAGL